MTGTEASGGEKLPDLLTVREAAKVLRISADLAYALVRAGVLPVLRLGERRVVIPRDALFRWISAQSAVRQNVSSGSVRSI
ncbi:MAG: helix-turn-helix domain-containing protein [Actinomycetota bacterium]